MGKGTCKQGERADLTGCTPASGEETQQDQSKITMADAAITDKWVAKTGIRIGDPSKPRDPAVYSDKEYDSLPIVYRGGLSSGNHVYITNSPDLAAMHGKVTKFRLAPGAMVYADPEMNEEMLASGFKRGEINGHTALFKLKAGSGITKRTDLWPYEKPKVKQTPLDHYQRVP